MPHDLCLFDDTAPDVAARVVAQWRTTPPLEKLRQMSTLNATLHALQRANMARLYPHEAPAQWERRLRVRTYGEALVAQVEGRIAQAAHDA